MRLTCSILLLSMITLPAFAEPVAIPEPASMTLFGVGLASMLLLRRSKKK